MTATTTSRAPRGIVKQQANERRWRQILDPLAVAYCELTRNIDDYVAGLPDQALADHLLAAEWPTQTNCWWASYQVAPLLLQAARREQYVRQLRAAGGRRG